MDKHTEQGAAESAAPCSFENRQSVCRRHISKLQIRLDVELEDGVRLLCCEEPHSGPEVWPSPRKRQLRLRDAAAPSAPEAGTRAPAFLFCPVEPEPAPGRPVPPRVPLCEQGRHFYPPAHCRAVLGPRVEDGRRKVNDSEGEREAVLGRMAFVPTRTGGAKKVRDKSRGSHSALPAGQHRPATRVGSSLAGIILSPCGSTRGSGLERIPTCQPLPRVTAGICPSLRIIARR